MSLPIEKLAKLNTPEAIQAQIEVLTAELYGIDREIAKHLAKESEEMAEKSLLAFYQCAWGIFESGAFIPNWHHTAMCEALEALYKNEINNLIIQISPGCSKSSLTSTVLPVWGWLQDPSLRFITASFSDKLALRDPVRSRRIIESEWFQSRWGDRFQLLKDTNRQSKYENNHFGYRLGTTPGGAGTGDRYEMFICFSKDELITTNIGELKIGDIVEKKLPVKLLTYNHFLEKKEWSDILEYESNPAKELYEVSFSNGKSFKCTKDHPIFIKDAGYTELKNCKIGDICYASKTSPKTLSILPKRIFNSSQQQILFNTMCGSESNQKTRSSLYDLRKVSNKKFQRFKTLSKSLLFEKLQRYFKRENSKKSCFSPLSVLWEKYRNYSFYDRPIQVLLSRMQNSSLNQEQTENLSYLQRNIYQDGLQTNFLFKNLCFKKPSNADFRGEESKLYTRGMPKQICSVLSKNSSKCDSKERWFEMSTLLYHSGRAWNAITYSPYRLRQKEWEFGQPNQFMSKLSWQNARESSKENSMEEVIITNIKLSSDIPVRVYNLRTQNRNYFCQGILVHNCDDPLKAQDAYSTTAKDKVWQWYTEAMSTRGGRNPRQCIMHQRLAEDDLIGRILANEDINKWEVLNLPMEFEKTTYLWTSTNVLPNRDPRTKEGELMWSSKYDIDYVRDKQKLLGSRGYAAQFQQRPVGKEGGIIKKDYLRSYSFVTKQLLLSSMDYIIGSWDLTFGDTGESYCVGQVWGRKGPDKYLIDQYRGKWDFPNQVRFMRQMKEDYPMIRGMLVEKKANGDALISTLKKEVPGLIAVKLNEIGGGDKMVRLMACITEFEAGNIYIPDRKYYAWVDDFINELTIFPVGKNDDQIDACTQALNYLALKSQTIQRYRMDEKELTKFINVNKERGLLTNKVSPSFKMQNSIRNLRDIFN